MIRRVYVHGLPDGIDAPLHRLRVEFPDGVPIQGDHVPKFGGGVRDKRQSMIDAGRLDIAIAATTEPSRPAAPYGKGVAVFVEVAVLIPRPGSHFGTGRNADRLKPAFASPFVAIGGAGRGDGDKVCRFVWDAMSGGAAGGAAWFDDDCQVAAWQGVKLWTARDASPAIEVAVVPLPTSDGFL